jgi:hypothetical protein
MDSNWKELAIARLMDGYDWSKPFATEYVMERKYNGLSHLQAYDHAMKSTWIAQVDKPTTTNTNAEEAT